MNKKEYLERLESSLGSLSVEERGAAMRYYWEFFEEAGEENESAVIASLGEPEQLAKSICQESTFSSEPGYVRSDLGENDYQTQTTFTPPPTGKDQAKKRSNSDIALIITILVVTFPLWIGLFGGLFGVVVGFICAACALVFATCGIGVALTVVGIVQMFFDGINGLFTLGTGLILAGLGWLIFLPLSKLIFKGMKALINACVKLFNKITGRTGAAL